MKLQYFTVLVKFPVYSSLEQEGPTTSRYHGKKALGNLHLEEPMQPHN